MQTRSATRESSSSRLIAPRPIRRIAAEAVARIDLALGQLAGWGVRIPADSRLHRAREILANGSQTGVLAPIHGGDMLGLRALELSFDYSAIAATLPGQRVAAIRRDLEMSLKGQIEPPEKARGPLQLQSQGIVRAAYARAGEAPTHPTRSPRLGISNPDLVLENGTQAYAIEAKRPQRSTNVLARFKDGCDQLRSFGLPGAVLVDVSDCVRNIALSEVDREVYGAGQSLIDEVSLADDSRKPEYVHVMVAGVYARVAWDSEDSPRDTMISVHFSSRMIVFARERNTLADHRARWLRSQFQVGLQRLTEALEEPCELTSAVV